MHVEDKKEHPKANEYGRADLKGLKSEAEKASQSAAQSATHSAESLSESKAKRELTQMEALEVVGQVLDRAEVQHVLIGGLNGARGVQNAKHETHVQVGLNKNSRALPDILGRFDGVRGVKRPWSRDSYYITFGCADLFLDPSQIESMSNRDHGLVRIELLSDRHLEGLPTLRQGMDPRAFDRCYSKVQARLPIAHRSILIHKLWEVCLFDHLIAQYHDTSRSADFDEMIQLLRDRMWGEVIHERTKAKSYPIEFRLHFVKELKQVKGDENWEGLAKVLCVADGKDLLETPSRDGNSSNTGGQQDSKEHHHHHQHLQQSGQGDSKTRNRSKQVAAAGDDDVESLAGKLSGLVVAEGDSHSIRAHPPAHGHHHSHGD